MSRLERLRTLVNQRINAAADDISRLLEGKIAEYEEEVRFFREENNNLQQRLLRVVSKPDLHILLVSPEEAGPSVDQENPDFLQIKQEEEQESPAAFISGKRAKDTKENKKATEKDCSNETPGTCSTKQMETDGQKCRRNLKRRAAQSQMSKSKISKKQ